MTKKRDDKQYGLGIETNIQLDLPNDATCDLWGICLRVNEGFLKKPLHQRNEVWPLSKRVNYVARLKDSKNRPIGAIATYQLDNGKPSFTWINDGWQRISTARDLLVNPQKYNENKESALKIIQNVSIPVQHRWYKTHEGALKDFQYVNMGTSLTAYEFSHGILTYMDNYKNFWEKIITDLHEIMILCTSKFTEGGNQPTREKKHKHKRDDFALFHRFCTKEKKMKSYKSGTSSVESIMKQGKNTNEWLLRTVFESETHEKVEKDLSLFKDLVNRESVNILEVWSQKVDPDGIHPVLHVTLSRWLLHGCIWKRFNKIPTKEWNKFLEKTMAYSNGTSSYPAKVITAIGESGAKRDRAIALGQWGLAKSIAEIVGSDLVRRFDAGEYKRKSQPKNIPGYDNSHQLPFSEFGENETRPEPSTANRARGANPVNDKNANT